MHGCTMSVFKLGLSLRNVLTPERIPSFIIPSPSRSPLCILSPFSRRHQPDRSRLLSQDSTEAPDYQQNLAPQLPHPLRPSPARGFKLRRHRRYGPTTEEPEVARDTDLSTCAAMSLEHVEKVTTPYGFRAVLAASPCVQRRESLFHKGQRRALPLPVVEVTHAETDFESSPNDPRQSEESAAPPEVSPMRLEPVKALGWKVMRAAHRALTPDRRRRTDTNH